MIVTAPNVDIDKPQGEATNQSRLWQFCLHLAYIFHYIFIQMERWMWGLVNQKMVICLF